MAVRFWEIHKHAPGTAIVVASTNFVTAWGDALRNYTDRMQIRKWTLPTSHQPNPSMSTVEDHIDALIPWTKLHPKSQAISASLATSSRTRRAKINNDKKIAQRNEIAACGEPMSSQLVNGFPKAWEYESGSRVVRDHRIPNRWQLFISVEYKAIMNGRSFVDD